MRIFTVKFNDRKTYSYPLCKKGSYNRIGRFGQADFYPSIPNLSVSILILISFFIVNFSLRAQESEQSQKEQQQEVLKKAKEAQEKAMEQLKNMGIDIDPKKKMTTEEKKALKDKLLKKADSMKNDMESALKPAPITHEIVDISNVPDKDVVVEIANRFYNQSYKQLDIFEKTEFDNDFKAVQKAKFSPKSVKELASKGAELLTFGKDHNFACVYIASAVKAIPTDTLSVNNFGAYLRIIDSTAMSLPVLLYADSLYSESPVILTQIGCSLLELNDDVKAEKYLKLALKYNPDFGQAHSALCEDYIRQGKFKDALTELFAGVKNIGASYQQASSANQQIQDSYNNSGSGNSGAGQDYLNDSKSNLKPPSQGTSPSNKNQRLKLPGFPDCKTPEEWILGGGFSNAVMAYNSYVDYMQTFSQEFSAVHKTLPQIPPNSVLRDYPNERFALDCITEMFFNYSKNESVKYRKSIDEIVQRVNDAKELYIKNFSDYSKTLAECIKGCKSEICFKECERKFCEKECPNANKFNEILKNSYNDYRVAFSGTVGSQKKLLDDLYNFTDSWFAKIESPYWSRIYAYEIRRVALSIAGNCYVAYQVAFQSPAMNSCGTDCSIFAVPYKEKPDDVSKDKTEGNDCPPIGKFKIPLAICELGLSCESIEFGCTAGVSASVKKNFKKKNTTVFLGVGIKGGLGLVDVGAKAGAVVTVSDNGEVADVGGKMDLNVSVGVGAAKVGASASGEVTVMEGFRTKGDVFGGLSKPK